MTALERAEQIVKSLLHGCVIPESHAENIRNMIYRAIVEHSNEESERRRKDAQRHNDFIAGCQQLLGTHDRLDVAIEAQLEKRRVATSKLLRAINTLRQMLVALRKAGMKNTVHAVEETLKALEGDE